MVKIEQTKYRLRVRCSKCEKEKTVTCNFQWQDIDAISEMCPHCFGDALVAKIRQFQRSEGNPDCFAKSEDFCNQYLCKFRKICLEIERRD